MSSWLNRLFGRRRPAATQEQLSALGLQSVSVFSQQGLDAYARAQSPLDDADEALATKLIIASHQKDREKVKSIGRQLNDAGGIERMKLLCYRARHRGGDDRWIEMMWSGIGDWMG